MTSQTRQRSFFKSGSLKYGENNNKGLESVFFTQSKQKRFLDLLASHRAQNLPAQFHGIDLSHVDLSNTDLTGVDLTGANLTNANLSGAQLVGTNLTNARLMRANLFNVNLTDVNLTNVVVDRMTQLSLQQALNQQWVKAAQKSIAGFDQHWEKLKNADGFYAFEAVLKRLTEWDLKNNVTITEIVEVIDSVIKSPEICHLVFQAAQGVSIHCHAHLLTSFNAMQGLTKFDKLLKEDAGHQEILALAKGLAKQNFLDETTLPIMRHQWSEGRRACNGEGTGPNVGEALKVQLALRHQLAAQLELPFPIKNPVKVTEVAGLTNSDKELAVDFINRYLSEQEQMVDALMSLPIWQMYLERLLGEKVIQADEDEALENLLRQETEKIMDGCRSQMTEETDS